MSYCNYELQIQSEVSDDVVGLIFNETVDSNAEMTLGELFDVGSQNGNVRERWFSAYAENWRTDAKDMTHISKKYPDILFDLWIQDTEDHSDMCHWYFKGGKRQVCPATITYDPFDETKLEEANNE